ncbi:hypothetical protein VOLCADRAFT_107678 [Volvox carteri f. nagariensis]|uniref:NAD(P)-binding domain-containing protein n=1 Tax=Volvox carteri f. nagariensis TaxID=3068 RepID=D8UFL0_VOLCA|nr:uncharacterized protein VOLCADRAFT_107678 [Volvox carteri f. nagariensis]EFJ41522.1 hypothetical protein VOLCADRAFT_107678 [Volvox carteri f. nagariensis]|eukprot:XP_002957467.1 hypothetical protein VOLCADRAFT_107678 [Volvox carteri f. nagariensis]
MASVIISVQNAATFSRVAGRAVPRRLPVVKVRAASSAASGLEGYKVLVAGATGGSGKEVVAALAAKNVPVRALVRDTSKAGSEGLAGLGSGTELVRGDVFQFASLPPAMEDCTAVICCTGARDPRDPLGPFNVDYQGTLNLIAAAKQKGVRQFVLISSIGADDLLNPLNLFWGVLFWKKRAEEELQRSGLTYTIVRPGGLKTKLGQGEVAGNIVMGAPGTFGIPPAKKSGSILRSQVADVCVAALTEPAAANKVVEVIAEKDAPSKPLGELFAGVNWF